ncbi:hypothetical protein D3C86_1202070 [compost metagenome]
MRLGCVLSYYFPDEVMHPVYASTKGRARRPCQGDGLWLMAHWLGMSHLSPPRVRRLYINFGRGDISLDVGRGKR